MTRDIIDRANELAEKEREVALAKICQRTVGVSLHHCEDCGEVIPELRRQKAIGCTRCIDCQTIYEHKQKGYRKC